MGKASRLKWERKIQGAIDLVSQSALGQSRPPWYESNLLWGPLATVLAIIFIWVPTLKADFRGLLWLAWLIALYPAWLAVANIGPRRPSYRIVICSIIIVAGGAGTYFLYTKFDNQPIAISPSEVKLVNLFDSQSRLRGYIDMSVYNRSDDPYYEIWVKILIDSDVFSAEKLDLDFPTVEERVRVSGDPRSVAISSGCLRGRDKESKAAFLCVIDALVPREHFKIKMTTSYARPEKSDQEIGIASMKVIRFAHSPGKHFDSNPGKEPGAASEHTIPEKFTSTTMIHFCPDIGEPWKSSSPITCTPNSKRY